MSNNKRRMEDEMKQISPQDQDRIKEIADRAEIFASEHGLPIYRNHIILAVALAHKHRPLNLTALYHAQNFDFVHDVWGIMQHIDLATGKMNNCFVPMYTRMEKENVRPNMDNT